MIALTAAAGLGGRLTTSSPPSSSPPSVVLVGGVSSWLLTGRLAFTSRPAPARLSSLFRDGNPGLDSLVHLGLSNILSLVYISVKCKIMCKDTLTHNCFLSELLVFSKKWANEQSATWANRSWSLICHERPERFSHSRLFVLSDLSASLTVSHLSWVIWANRSQLLNWFEQNERMSKWANSQPWNTVNPFCSGSKTWKKDKDRIKRKGRHFCLGGRIYFA